MVSLSYAVAIAAISMLFGGAVAWGVLRTTVEQLRESVREMRADIKTLNTVVVELQKEVVALTTTDRVRHNTGPNPVHS